METKFTELNRLRRHLAHNINLPRPFPSIVHGILKKVKAELESIEGVDQQDPLYIRTMHALGKAQWSLLESRDEMKREGLVAVNAISAFLVKNIK